MQNHDLIAKACEAQRAAAYPEPDSYEGDEVIYITAQEVLDDLTTGLKCGEILRDCLTDDDCLMAVNALRKGDLADVGFILENRLNIYAEERAARINRCREEGLSEFRAERGEYFGEDR